MLLGDEPTPTGDERWDVLFAGLAEHLAIRDGQRAPTAFQRGVFVADYEIEAA